MSLAVEVDARWVGEGCFCCLNSFGLDLRSQVIVRAMANRVELVLGSGSPPKIVGVAVAWVTVEMATFLMFIRLV